MDAVVFAAAPLEPSPRLRARLAGLHDPFVVAADRGAATALAFGCEPAVVIGDFDSIEPATLATLRARNVSIESYPRDKDATDGQLAVERALRVEPSALLLLGFLGGERLDQAAANLLLLLRIQVRATLLDAHNEATVVRPDWPLAWQPEPREIVSLIPLGGEVGGVRTAGLRWPLSGARLRLGDTRGVSNEAIADATQVSVAAGTLLVTRHFPGG